MPRAKTYPAWICAECGVKYASDDAQVFGVSTFHIPDKDDKRDRCGWCGTNEVPLTEPRDYGYPKWPGQCLATYQRVLFRKWWEARQTETVQCANAGRYYGYCGRHTSERLEP